jgi:hypothetical protein
LTGAFGAAHRALLGQSARGSYLGRSFAGGARVLVLFNVPRTPQHNAPIESFWGELKLELEALGELQMRIADASQGPVSLAEAGDPATNCFRPTALLS